VTTRELPQEFSDLTSWTKAWGHADEPARNHARVTSDFAEIQMFYDAMMPRMDDILSFLGKHGLDAEQRVINLSHLAKSFIEASVCVELFHQPTVPDGFDYRRFNIFSPT
jgi:hypothetical protein